MSNPSNPAFDAALAAFVLDQQTRLDAHLARIAPTTGAATLSIETGRRYVRIVRTHGGGARDVWCFVEIETGDVYAHRSWKGPSGRKLGNVYVGGVVR